MKANDRAAAVAAICAAIEATRCPCQVTIRLGEAEQVFDVPGHNGQGEPAREARSPKQAAEPEPPQGPKKQPRNLQLRGLILQVLEDADPRRLTGREIFERMRKLPEYQGWQWKTVEKALLALRAGEIIDNETDEHGSGYGQL